MTDIDYDFKPLVVEYDGDSKTGHITLVNDKSDMLYDTSVANAIRRSVMELSPTYMFPSEYTSEQIKEINTVLGTSFDSSNKLYSVVYSSFDNIQSLSITRLALVPLMLTEDTTELLKNKFLYFTLSDPDDVSKPYLHAEDEQRLITTHDLVGRIYPDPEGTEESKMEVLDEEQIKKIFVYNMPLFRLSKGDVVHIIARPEMGYGAQNSRFAPCPFRYHYVSDPASTESEPNKKEMDYLKSDEQIKRMCDNPSQIMQRFEFNGKRYVRDALVDGLEYLVRQINYFLLEYNDDSSTIVAKHESTVPGLQVITIQNPPENTPVQFIARHTLIGLISSQLLYSTLNRIYNISGTDQGKLVDLLSHTCIASKQPHPLPRVMEFKIQYQLPINDSGFKDSLGISNPQDAFSKLMNEVCDRLASYFTFQIERIKSH